MRGIAYDRIKRGVLLASVGAAFLLPASAAQARPPAWAPAWGSPWAASSTLSSHSPAFERGSGSSSYGGGTITGHRIG